MNRAALGLAVAAALVAGAAWLARSGAFDRLTAADRLAQLDLARYTADGLTDEHVLWAYRDAHSGVGAA